jgi:hypothetical protein
MAIGRRHDEISHERQKRLGALLVVTNLIVGGISLAIVFLTDWNPELTRGEWIAFGLVILISWLNLLIAAGVVGWVFDLALSMLPDGVGSTDAHPDDKLLERHRMAFYYVGVWSNLLALGLIIEVSGGLGESPFVPLLIAFVLTGQQLSRFRTQSGLLYVSGLALVGLMVLCEPLASEPPESAPHELTMVVAFLALAAGGLLNYVEKPHNYLLEKHLKPPSRARIYQDGCGAWRVALLHSIHRQDPVLLGGDVKSALPIDGQFPDGLQERFEAYLRSMAEDARWSPVEPDWPQQCSLNFMVKLNPPRQKQS